MRKYGRDNRPYVKPVKRIELSEKNIKLRWIAIVVLLAIGVAAIFYGLTSALNTEPGWQTVEVTSEVPNCGGDFVFMYDFSQDGGAATAKFKQLTTLYQQAAEEAFRIFTPDVLEEGVQNVAYLNAHLNETVAVDEMLYQALALVAAYGDRHVFTAPAAVEYNRMFLCESDGEAIQYDPAHNPETAAWLQELSVFINDPAHISVEVLGENQVRLHVSEEYLAFAEEYGIETFLDFGWMTNAFRADYLASYLTESGFTNGYLVSYDGFTRNLDSRGNSYSFNVFDRVGTNINMPVQMHYSQPASIVFLRDYPMTEEDRWHYYSYENGEITTVLLDSADGLSKSAVSDLVSYSTEMGCAEILLQMAPVFISDDFRTDSLRTMAEKGVYSIWCEDTVLKYNDAAASLTLVENAGAVYTTALEK